MGLLGSDSPPVQPAHTLGCHADAKVSCREEALQPREVVVMLLCWVLPGAEAAAASQQPQTQGSISPCLAFQQPT